jgi:hypothetical protein
MVFLARMLRASRDLNDYKIVLVNDRQDLEEQLGDTATLIGGRVNVIETRGTCASIWATDSSDINMVMVHKFQEHKQTLTNTVAEALGTYLAMPAGKTFRRGEHVGPHHPDDRRGAPHAKLGPGRQPVRGLPQRHAHRLHRHAADHRAPRREARRTSALANTSTPTG